MRPGARIGIAAAVGAVLLGTGGAAPARTAGRSGVAAITRQAIDAAFARAAAAYGASAATFVSGTSATGAFPNFTRADGTWNTTDDSAWTSGFLAGAYWMLYEHTHAAVWKQRALATTVALRSRASVTTTHDVGFQLLPSYGNAARLSPGSSPAGAASFDAVLTTGARSLASRYSATVRATRSWDNDPANANYRSPTDFQVIVDNLMNVELLYLGAQLSPADGAWRADAVRHATTTWDYFHRPDGSTRHLVVFDVTTGRPRAIQPYGAVQPQAYSLGSTWARGQAWAIAGYALAYRETHDARFLDDAHRSLDWYLAHLPSDAVPYWDFSAPASPRPPRDSSAAAVVASALLELSPLEPDAGRRRSDVDAATRMLRSLLTPAYLSTSGQAVLAHATVNGATCIVAGVIDYTSPQCKADTGVVYADYYFLLALEEYRQIVM